MQMGSKVSVPTDGPGLTHEAAAGGAHKEEQERLTPPAPTAGAGTHRATGTKGQAEVNDWTETGLLTEGGFDDSLEG